MKKCMMRILIFCLLITTNNLMLYAQQIKMIRVGTEFEYNGQILSQRKTKKLLKTNDAAYKEFKKANGAFTKGRLLIGIGGLAVGISSLGSKPDLILTGTGLILILPGYMLYRKAEGRYKNALSIYNGQSVSSKQEYYFICTPVSIGITCKF
jgi:hypothetical protein